MSKIISNIDIFVEIVLTDKHLVLTADHDASEVGEEEDKENKAEAVEVNY